MLQGLNRIILLFLRLKHASIKSQANCKNDSWVGGISGTDMNVRMRQLPQSVG